MWLRKAREKTCMQSREAREKTCIHQEGHRADVRLVKRGTREDVHVVKSVTIEKFFERNRKRSKKKGRVYSCDYFLCTLHLSDFFLYFVVFLRGKESILA